jgi:two-component system, OmpR family, phosphate regulon response regulator PhoB
MTVFLTEQSQSLVGLLRRDMPDIDVQLIGSELPRPRTGGMLFSFIDWILPDGSGLEMVRRLRDCETTRHGHITMVLEAPDPEDQRRALRAGADDYLIGPLDLANLAKRLQAYAGQSSPAVQSVGPRLHHGDLMVDQSAHQVRWRGETVPLRPNEFALLVHFLTHADRLFSRQELIAEIGKDSERLDERTVDVWVGRMRRALTARGVPDPLRTVRSMGYVLDSI